MGNGEYLQPRKGRSPPREAPFSVSFTLYSVCYRSTREIDEQQSNTCGVSLSHPSAALFAMTLASCVVTVAVVSFWVLASCSAAA